MFLVRAAILDNDLVHTTIIDDDLVHAAILKSIIEITVWDPAAPVPS
jgi:hypothetical protein